MSFEQTEVTTAEPGVFFPGTAPEVKEAPGADLAYSDAPEAPAPIPEAAAVPVEAQANVADSPVPAAAAEQSRAEDSVSNDLPAHDLAALFPMMNKVELKKLSVDIEANGLQEPIVTHEGKIVDGRNRREACRLARVVPRFVEWRDIYTGPMSLADWIWSKNGLRRNLTIDQVTMIKVKLHLWEEQEAARRRQVEAGSRQGHHGKEGGRGNSKALKANSPEAVTEAPCGPDAVADVVATSESGPVRTKLARAIGTSGNKVRQAIKILPDPIIVAEVTCGKKRLSKAFNEFVEKMGGHKQPKAEASAKVIAAVNHAISLVDADIDQFEGEDRKHFRREFSVL
jgi:hypothetical protein